MVPIAQRILDLIDRADISDEVDPERIQTLKDLAIHGEWEVAIECLCDNVAEVDKRFDDGWISDLAGLVEELGLKPRYGEIVRDLLHR